MPLVKITTYADGSEARMHNKRVQFKQLEDASYLLILESIVETPGVSPIHYTLKRDKLAQVVMRISDEMLEALVVSYVKYREARGQKVNFKPFNDI